MIPENYFSFFNQQFQKSDSVFIVYEGQSLNLKILNQQELYFRLTDLVDLKRLADFLLHHEFANAVFFTDKGFWNYSPCFQYIKTQSLICINKEQRHDLKNEKFDCLAQLNVGKDDVKNQEDILYFFKNILGSL